MRRQTLHLNAHSGSFRFLVYLFSSTRSALFKSNSVLTFPPMHSAVPPLQAVFSEPPLCLRPSTYLSLSRKTKLLIIANSFAPSPFRELPFAKTKLHLPLPFANSFAPYVRERLSSSSYEPNHPNVISSAVIGRIGCGMALLVGSSTRASCLRNVTSSSSSRGIDWIITHLRR